MARRVLLVLAALLAMPLAGCLESGWSPARAPAGGPLAVALTGPDAVLVGATAAFGASAEGVPAGAAFWFWDFGDGIEHEDVDLRDVEHAFADPGRRVVTVTVVDAQGRRGVAAHHVAVNQEYRLDGTVAGGSPLSLAEPPARASFDARDGLATVRLDLALARAEPLALPVDVLPTRVVVRILAPENANVTGAEPVLFEDVVRVPAAGETLAVSVPGDLVRAAGPIVLELEAEEGAARFEAVLRLDYDVP